jgi:hypothetical protein
MIRLPHHRPSRTHTTPTHPHTHAPTHTPLHTHSRTLHVECKRSEGGALCAVAKRILRSIPHAQPEDIALSSHLAVVRIHIASFGHHRHHHCSLCPGLSPTCTLLAMLQSFLGFFGMPSLLLLRSVVLFSIIRVHNIIGPSSLWVAASLLYRVHIAHR